jgi:hypothetical protein
MSRRYRRRRSLSQQWRALPPAGKVFVLIFAVVLMFFLALSGHDAPAPAPAVTVTATPPPGDTPPAPADVSPAAGGGSVNLPHPHVYACVGHHVRICT